MPRMATRTEATVTTTSEVELSTRLVKQLKAKLDAYKDLVVERSRIDSEIDTAKTEIETLFADAGEYNALLAGVRVDGVPLKRVEGQTTPVFDKVGLMKRFKITPAQWDQFVDNKPKKGHLSISIKKGKDDDV
jgi:hypothetical protein